MFDVVATKLAEAISEITTKTVRPSGYPASYRELHNIDLSSSDDRIKASDYVSIRVCGKKYDPGVSALSDFLDSLRALDVVSDVAFLISRLDNRPTTVVLAMMVPLRSIGDRAGYIVGRIEAGHRLFKRSLPPLVDSSLEFVDTSEEDVSLMKRDLAIEWSGEEGIENIIWLPLDAEAHVSEELREASAAVG